MGRLGSFAALGLLSFLLVLPKITTANPVIIEADDDFPNGTEYRLPDTVKPRRYEIFLSLDNDFSETLKFAGSVKIQLKTDQQNVNRITLHSLYINYTDANITVVRVGAAEDIFLDYTLDDRLEFIEVELSEPLVQNVDYVLSFEDYLGELHTDMYGFYISSYIDDTDTEEFIATTQFQATHARRAFPSFDEPSFKAVFQVAIERPIDYNSLSNTNKAGEPQQGSRPDLEIDTYEDTPVMSTYLLAFIVSKFKPYSGLENSTYDVWSREEALETAEYSYDVGPRLLSALEDYVGLLYKDSGTGKMDQVAIPDFSAGAMENWGLVTYRETMLLWDSAESTAISKQRIAAVIAHEFAHMWFGNLVTMDWWSATWLNEGFARYFQYFITAEVETEWELENQFIIEQQQVIFAADGVIGAAALTSDAFTPSQISNKFQSISYNKGAAVIRMMRNFIGEDLFKEALHNYLVRHSSGNTVPSDLWESISEEIGNVTYLENVNLSTVMTLWTEQPGFPVVTVSLRDDGAAVLTQERFLLNADQESSEAWYVPITYTISHNPDFDNTSVYYWLLPTEDLEIPNILHGGEGWIIVNVKQSGYYRVNYDDLLWNALHTTLHSDSFTDIDVINRAQITDDSLNLARADIISYNRALDITAYLQQETQYHPWYAAFNAFAFLRRRINPTTNIGIYLKTHIQTLMNTLYESISFNITQSVAHIDILKTALALQWACELDVEDCITRSEELFDSYKANHTDFRINPNIRSVVYCTAIRNADSDENWNFLWERFTSSRLASEQAIIITALGCTKNTALATQYLNKTITPNSGIRSQDANTVFSSILSGNPEGFNTAFAFLRNNFRQIADSYGGLNPINGILNGIADRITTQEQLEALQALVADFASELSDTESAVGTARANIDWVRANEQELSTWLTQRYGTSGAATFALTVPTLLALVVTTLLNLRN